MWNRRSCQACWWLLWIDCFNEQDCMQISRNNEQYGHEQRYQQEFEHFDIRNFTSKELLKEIFIRIKSKINIFKNRKKIEKLCEEKWIRVEDIPF